MVHISELQCQHCFGNRWLGENHDTGHLFALLSLGFCILLRKPQQGEIFKQQREIHKVLSKRTDEDN